MSWEKLPRELLDMVTDHLHGDQPSLRACSLVNKTWLPSSRYHLFYAIRLEYWHGHQPNLKSETGVLERFLSDGQNVWMFVRQLQVDPAHEDQLTLEHSGEARNLLQAIIRSLPKLHTLIFAHLENMSPHFFGNDESASSHIYEPRVHLPNLVLWDMQEGYLYFWLHLRAFASIGKLHVLNSKTQSPADLPPGLDESNFPCISSLVGGTRSSCVAMIPLACIGNTLTSLSIHFEVIEVDSDSTRSFRELFLHTAPNLEFLRLDFSDMNMSPEFRPLRDLSISSCVSLRSIALCIYSGSSNSSDESEALIQWSEVLRLLGQVPLSIQTITITLTVYYEDAADDEFNEKAKVDFEWHQLDAQLMSFEELRELQFVWERRDSEYGRWQPYWEFQVPPLESWKESLQQLLPRMRTSGRMKFL